MALAVCSDTRRRVKTRLTYLGYRGAAELIRMVPEGLAVRAGSVAARALYRFKPDQAALHARHMRRVLGSDLSDAEADRWTRRALGSYSRYWVEGARLGKISSASIEQRMVMERGFDLLVDAMGQGRGVVLALPHMGSWEWGGAWIALRGYPMTTVAEVLDPPELYDWFVSEREAMGLRILPLQANTSEALLRTLHSGGLVGLLCDRDLTGTGVEVEFFGERTTLPAGPAMLALRTGAVLMSAAVYSGPGRDHTAVISPPIEAVREGRLRKDVARVTQEIALSLEALIRRAPDQWHLFQPNWPSDRPRSSTREILLPGSSSTVPTQGPDGASGGPTVTAERAANHG